jgi:hypothetical protein
MVHEASHILLLQVLSKTLENIGEKIDQACGIIETENPDLDGIILTIQHMMTRKNILLHETDFGI